MQLQSKRRKILEGAAITMMGLFSIGFVVAWFELGKNTSSQSSYEVILGRPLDRQAEQTAWNQHFDNAEFLYGKDPEPFIAKIVDRLPVGEALDLASGEGRDSVFLAKKGFNVEAIDISESALRKARRLAAENHVSIRTTVADLRTYEIKADTYQVIVNMGYVNRGLIPKIYQGLKKGGILVFQNRTIEELSLQTGRTPWRENLLELGEAKKLLKEFEIIFYEEVKDEQNAFVSILAQKK